MNLKLREGGLKVQHGIIAGLKPILAKLLKIEPERITRIIPGEIKNTRGHGDEVNVRVTVPLSNGSIRSGWKAIAFAGGTRQEIFVSTRAPHIERDELGSAFRTAGAVVITSGSTTKSGKSLTSRGDDDEGLQSFPVHFYKRNR